MHPLAILSSLAIFASALAAPNIEYSPGPTPTPKPSAVSIPAAPEPTRPPATDELRRRSLIPALEMRGVLEKRVDTCPLSNYYSCGNGYCCETGTTCYDYGLCYDPNMDYAAQVSSILASYSNEFTLDGYYSSVYESYMSELSIYASTTGNYNYATGTLSSTYQTDSASTDSSSGSGYSSSSSSKKKKGGKVGMIVGIVVGVVVIIIALAVWWFIRRRNQKAVATTTAVQQPLMSQAPPPPPMQPPTPAPMSPPPPPQSPYSPSPYDQYAAAAAAGKHNSAYGYQNYPTPPPPGTVEMSSNQKMNPQPNQQPYGQNPYPNGAQYQPPPPPPPPPPPAVGVVEASGDSVYRQPQQQLRPESQYAPQYTPGTSTISPQSTGVASELSGQHFISPQTTGATGQTSGAIPPPPPQSGPVYEMDSSNYRQY